MNHINQVAMVLGYVLIGISSGCGLYYVTYLVAELVIQGENRFFLAVKIQPALIKYFLNRDKINELLKEIE